MGELRTKSRCFLQKGVQEQKSCIFALLQKMVSCTLHSAPGGSPSHVSTGLRPYIPSLYLSKAWRPIAFKRWVICPYGCETRFCVAFFVRILRTSQSSYDDGLSARLGYVNRFRLGDSVDRYLGAIRFPLLNHANEDSSEFAD